MADSINWGALLDLFNQKDPRAIQVAQKLTPEEQQQFFDFQKAQTPKGLDPASRRADSSAADLGPISIAPEALAGGVGMLAGASLPWSAGQGAATGIGAALANKVPAAVRSGLGSYAGYELGNQLGDAVGAPGWLKTIFGLTGAHMGGGFGGGAAKGPEEGPKSIFSTIAPETDEALAARGTFRVPENGKLGPGTELSRQAPPPEPGHVMPSNTTVQGGKMGRVMGPGKGGLAPLAVSDYREHQLGGVQASRPDGGGLGGMDTAGLRGLPNLNTTRTPADILEQVTGSSRKGWADPRSLSLDYNEHDPAIAELQARLEALMGSHAGARAANPATRIDVPQDALDSLESILNATGNQTPNPLGHGTMPGVRRKPR